MRSINTVAVLMGGISSERDISLQTGKAVSQALRNAGFSVVDIDITSDTLLEINGFDFDIAFVALHGEFGEDGRIQQQLEEKRIAYTGTGPQGSCNAMDKLLTKELFEKHGIATPEWTHFTKSGDVLKKAREFGVPLVVKPRLGGSSIGVSIVEDEACIENALKEALRYDDELIIERKIEGRELTVGILDEKALPILEIRPKQRFYDFNAKYEDDATEYIFDTGLSQVVCDRVKQLALDAHKALDCRHFSRVDIMLDDKCKAYVLEINTIPGFTSHSLLPKAAQKAGYTFEELVVKIIELGSNRTLDCFENRKSRLGKKD